MHEMLDTYPDTQWDKDQASEDYLNYRVSQILDQPASILEDRLDSSLWDLILDSLRNSVSRQIRDEDSSI